MKTCLPSEDLSLYLLFVIIPYIIRDSVADVGHEYVSKHYPDIFEIWGHGNLVLNLDMSVGTLF